MKTKECFGCDGTGQRHGKKYYLCGGSGELKVKKNVKKKSFNLSKEDQSMILRLVKNV